MTFYRFGRGIVRIVVKFRYHITIVNKEILRAHKKEGFILAANHVTNGDPLFIGIGFKEQVRFMAKEELFHNPILGKILLALGTFPVSRGHGDQSAIFKAIDIVKNGGVLGIFPEGTRSKDGNLGRAKSGAVLVAGKTGGDIYPVGIFYGKKRLIRQEVIVTYGQPIENSKLNLSGEHFEKTDLKEASRLVMEGIAKAIQQGKEYEENQV